MGHITARLDSGCFRVGRGVIPPEALFQCSVRSVLWNLVLKMQMRSVLIFMTWVNSTKDVPM
jgi:hypothetical protein